MRRTLLKALLLEALLLVGLAGCGDGLGPLPLDVTIQANRSTAAPGETVNFAARAQGRALVGVAVDYGDGNTSQYVLSGSRTARMTFSYAYSDAGTYTVRVTVTDAMAGTKEASVEVRVQ